MHRQVGHGSRGVRHQIHGTHTIKSQVLADFMVELTNPSPPEPVRAEEKPWTMYFDGSRSYGRSGAGILIVSPRGERIRCIIRFNFPATNNVSKYEALLARL